MNKYFPGTGGMMGGQNNPLPAPQATPQAQPQPQERAMQGLAGTGNAPMPNPRIPFSYSSAQQLEDLKRTGLLEANKSLTTSATRRQLEGAVQVENIVNDPEVKKQVVDASQYAGALRKGKAALAALSQTNPAAYENYLALKNQTMVLLQNRIKTLDQMGATDKQREELQGLYSKTMDTLTSNPSQFITQFNKLGTTLDTISQAVQKSASPVADVNRLEGFKPVSQDGGRISIVSPDGKRGTIPASQLQEALKAGYKES